MSGMNFGKDKGCLLYKDFLIRKGRTSKVQVVSGTKTVLLKVIDWRRIDACWEPSVVLSLKK